jgi:hypothetical protein
MPLGETGSQINMFIIQCGYFKPGGMCVKSSIRIIP